MVYIMEEVESYDLKPYIDKLKNYINKHRIYIYYIKTVVFIIFLILLYKELWFYAFLVWLAFLPDEVELIRFFRKLYLIAMSYYVTKRNIKDLEDISETIKTNGNKEL